MNTDRIKFFTVADLIIVIALLYASFFLFKKIYRSGESADIVEIYIDNNLQYTLPLSVDKSFPLKTPIGSDTIVIKDGSVFIKESPCPRQICVKRGPISRPSSSIVCVPGHLLISVKKNREEDVIDAISR